MRTYRAFCLALVVVAAACGRTSDHREFELQGQILTVAADRMEANVKHEDIKGFMAAMTMPYKVREAREYDGLQPGDLITATLVVISNDAYLKDVKRTGSAPLDQPPGAALPPASSGFELVKVGQTVPDVTFTNQDGRAVRFDSFKGSAVVVTFTYTNCPLPTFCPLMDRHFATLQSRLKEKKNALNVRLLSVSIDPAVDTPPVLKKHAETLGADSRLWTFVTLDRDELDQWASRFGISVSRALNDPRDITHNLRTAIVDRQGSLVKTYIGNEWTPSTVLADLESLAGVD